MNCKMPVLVLCVAAGIGALHASKSTTQHEVDGRRFDVPVDRIFDMRVAWLPPPSKASFTYILDFAADKNLIPPHIVLVQARQDVCGAGQAQMVRVACGVETTKVPLSGNYQKVYPIPDYLMAWDYYAIARNVSRTERMERLQVAYCSPISPNPARPSGTAICTAIWSVDGLVLTLGFEERELPDLRKMRNRATAMLMSWKVR